MPRNDYACPRCNRRFDDLLTRASDTRPRCPRCAGPLDWLPSTAPHIGGLDWSVDLTGDGAPTRITSIQQADRLERESMARYRNGEGAPIAFRMLHQNRSNREVSAFDGLGVDPPDVRKLPNAHKIKVGTLDPASIPDPPFD